MGWHGLPAQRDGQVARATLKQETFESMNAGKFLKYLILVVVAGNLAVVGYVFLSALTPKVIPMPNPNGYDDFVKAGLMLKGKPYDYPKMSHEELSAFVSQNADALKLAEVGLERECRVPDDYSPENIQRFKMGGPAIYDLGLNFCAQGRLAALEHRTNDAVESYLQSIRLGGKSSRGGFTNSKSHGIICEHLGWLGLQPWTNSLDLHQCLKVAQTLETIDDQEEPFEENVRRQRIMMRNTRSLVENFSAVFAMSSFRKLCAGFITTCQKNQLERRQLMLAFAIRAYELERGKRPASLADLVPAYLKAIPQDPATGTNLVYSP